MGISISSSPICYARLYDLNIIRPFRYGNGRSQRILLSAIGEAAGHPIALDVTTRERMVATSIAAANGDLGGFTRLITEATDPRRVRAMRGALGFLQKNLPPWNDTYIATTTAGQRYDGTLVDRTRTDFMMRVTARPSGWIAIGDAADLPRNALAGKPLSLTAAHFVPDATPASSVRPDRAPGRLGPSPGM